MRNGKTLRATKCSKPAGQYCRLHNPAPPVFTSVEDVFKKLNTTNPKRKPVKNTSPAFQPFTATRALHPDVPERLEDHINLSSESSQFSDLQRKVLTGYTGMGAGVCNPALLGRPFSYIETAPNWRDSVSPIDFRDREELIDYLKELDRIVEERHAEPKIVYRGTPIYGSLQDEIGASIGRELKVSDTAGIIKGLKEYYKPGKIFDNPAYLSTSHSAHVAAKWAQTTAGSKQTYYDKAEISGIVFELKTNAGLDVTGLGRKFRAWEREVLLPRDTHFKVVNVITAPAEYKTVSGYDNLRAPETKTEKTFQNLAVIVQMVEVDKNGNEITTTEPHKPSTSLENIIP